MSELTPGLRLVVEWLGLASVITFVASLFFIPLLISRLPPDYFVRHRQVVEVRHQRHPLVAKLVFLLRNCLGTLFLLAGIAMLVLPGQGVITILIGISLMDFPRKHRLEDYLVRRPGVIRTLNWLRKKQKKQPFAL